MREVIKINFESEGEGRLYQSQNGLPSSWMPKTSLLRESVPSGIFFIDHYSGSGKVV